MQCCLAPILKSLHLREPYVLPFSPPSAGFFVPVGTTLRFFDCVLRNCPMINLPTHNKKPCCVAAAGFEGFHP